MLGDGINDASSFTQANIGIGKGTDIDSADVVLAKNDPRDMVHVIRLSCAMMPKMRSNRVWATAYNVAAVPAAAGLL